MRTLTYAPSALELALCAMELRLSAGVSAQMVLAEPLLVRVPLSALAALVRLVGGVAASVSAQAGQRVGAEAAHVAHVRPLLGVAEPHVLLQRGLLHGGVVAVGAAVAHVGPRRVLAQPVGLKLVLRHAAEVARVALKVRL